MIKRILLVSLLWGLVLAGAGGGVSLAQIERLSPDAVGEAFGNPVTSEEFAYYYKTALIFTRTGKAKEERDEEEVVQEAWQNLIFLHEAKDLGIAIGQDELEKEIKRLLSEKNIEYESDDYHIWVVTQIGEDSDVFEQRIKDLLTINRFMRVKTTPEIKVTEEEMGQKFLNQYNSFESEYIKFDNQEDAQKFFEKVKNNPKLWRETYEEKKPLGQKGASWINIMSLEALIDLWKIPKEDAYRILDSDEGSFISAKFYYGDAVFRLLHKRQADVTKYDDKKKQYYKDLLTQVKKREIIKDYFEDLLKRANYRDYVAEDRRASKIEELKKKSLLVLETSSGNIELKLFPENAPKACENFIELTEKEYYNGIIFHRVIKDFMIQGGDPDGTGTGGESIWGEPFADEVSDDILFDKPGLLAMANSGANTNTSQFFITVKSAPHLNKRHTIFGEVVSGYEVVEKISNVAIDSNNKPKKDVKIIKAYIKEQDKTEF